jgi:outer membrane protein assembly factor BamA
LCRSPVALITLLAVAQVALAVPSRAAAEDTANDCVDGDVPARPERARCVAEGEERPNPWLYPPRLLLAVPRLMIGTATEALVLLARVQDETHLVERAQEVFFNEERTFGLFPTAFYETGMGPNVGARLIARDLFGRGEGLRMRAGYGGPVRQIYEARFHSGARLPLRLNAGLGYQRDDSRDFYGIGNADEVDPSAITAPIDARTSGVAVETEYQRQLFEAGLGADVPLSGRSELYVAHAIRFQRLGTIAPDDDGAGTPQVSEIFTEESVPGIGRDLRIFGTRVGLRIDDRDDLRTDMPRALPGAGLRLDMWSSLEALASAPRAVYGRLGFDLQPFINLFRGDRVLRLRLRGVSVVGDLDEIPFVDLPMLGGSMLLRGYPTQRFRGQLSLLSTVEYRYPVQERLSVYLFVDGGRVYANFDEVSLSSLKDSRLGFGGGIVFFNARVLLGRVQLASSIDGGFFVDIRFSPTDRPSDD